MKRIELLSQIINSMSKAEKRYFKLYSAIQEGKKEYVFLYDQLENERAPQEVYEAFCETYGKKGFENSLQYLYKQLLNSLTLVNTQEKIQQEIFRFLSYAEILYERKIVSQALVELNRAKGLAELYEQDILLLLIRRTELKYISESGYMELTEKQLVSKQTKLNESMKITRATNMHISLFTTLQYRLNTLGEVRTKEQKEIMNDLVLSELNLVANNSHKGFESTKLHLLFQASYYLHTGSYKSAIRFYAELMDLFEAYDHLKQKPPIYYFTTIEGILNSLLVVGLYNEMLYFIDKLRQLENGNYPVDFTLKVKWTLFFYEAEYFIYNGRFDKAGILLEDQRETLFKKENLLVPENRLRLWLLTAVIHTYNLEFTAATRAMKRIFLEGKIYHVFPVFKVARLLQLLIKAESGDYELMENEIRSMKRIIRQEKQGYKTENLVFRFVRLYPIPRYEKFRNKHWKKFSKSIAGVRNNKYEIQLLRLF
ncbi:MAG: hypothetical protein LUG98_10040, partial [Tannerellaceae bacterium]|nr:hypothetical protein [Tannerellaceae bacterium]